MPSISKAVIPSLDEKIEFVENLTQQLELPGNRAAFGIAKQYLQALTDLEKIARSCGVSESLLKENSFQDPWDISPAYRPIYSRHPAVMALIKDFVPE